MDEQGNNETIEQKAAAILASQSKPAFKGGKDSLDAKGDASVLAGLMGRRTAEVYELRKKGIIPPDGATLRAGISSYISWLQAKAAGRDGDADTKAKMQKTALDAARTEEVWLNVMIKRGELENKAALDDILTPAFLVLRDELLQLAHEHPELSERIKKSLIQLAQHGRHLVQKGEEARNNLLATLTAPVENEDTL